ncbi:MAG: response regulator [Cyclobacteriaceae bacterium]|nr:response regulator [Cyclobacteriaceae bacterium]
MPKSLIYIIEDDPALGTALKKILEVNGYGTVVVFTDGKLCFEQLKTNSPSLIILDFSLETLNGLDVLKFIKKEYPRNKVVIFSSLANDIDLMEKCKEAGALAYFNKNEEGRTQLIDWMKNKLKRGFLSFLK